MPNIKIDGKEYDLESLPEEVRSQLASLQFTEKEIARLKARIAVFSTAHNAYAKALKDALATIPAKNAH